MRPLVVAYDPTWPEQFAAESRLLVAAIGDLLCGPVEHIGSTAVPGMPGKPLIDMMAPVSDLSVAEAAVVRLERLDHHRRPHRVDAVRFVKPATDDEAQRTHHLHLTVPGSDLWRERLAFRDALRRDPRLVAEYAALKQELLAHAPGRLYDARDKRDFVRRVLASVGHPLRDDRLDR